MYKYIRFIYFFDIFIQNLMDVTFFLLIFGNKKEYSER